MRALLIALAVLVAAPAATVSDVCAQANCRQKCMDEENACLARTGNKGQCGDRAKTCAEKCK
jgi:hypothetical protein